MNGQSLTAAADAWREACCRLAEGLRQNPDPEFGLALLKRIVRHFGYLGYPGFIKLLLITAESDDEYVKRRLADTLALALRRDDLPTGQLTSWGTTDLWRGASGELQVMSAGRINGHFFGAAPRRSFGPIEYLTVWYCQRTQRPFLSDAGYGCSVERLLELLNHSGAARALYPLKIETDLATEPEGAYTRRTRSRLGTLAAAWKRGDPPARIADQLIGASLAARAQTGRDWILRDL